LSRQQPFIDIDPSIARKLLHDAAVYAAGFGLAPSEDFAQAEAIFGDIPMAMKTFPFGKNGKPFFHFRPARLANTNPAYPRHAGETGWSRRI
jgi:hypothetical protein